MFQPKRFALLAYLGCERSGCTRDSLLTVFWPEMDAHRGRAALRKALHFLRSHLGRDTIQSDGSGYVSLDPERLTSDVVRFRRALNTGDPARALTLYRGDLLPGFFADAPEFQRWLDLERGRLRRTAHEAALRLSRQNANEGRAERALFWARRAQEISPGDEETARMVIRLLDRLGRPGAAAAEYAGLEEWMRRELDMEPAPETTALIRDVTNGAPEDAEASGADGAGTAGEDTTLFREIVETAADMIFRTDVDGYYTYVSPACGTLLGYGCRELVGTVHRDVVREDFRDQLHEFYLRQVRERTPTTHYEFPAVRADGETVWVEQRVQLLLREGEPIGLQGAARDVTTRKRLEQAQRALATEDRASGLPNERGLRILAQDRLRSSLEEGRKPVLAVIDVEPLGAEDGPSVRQVVEVLGGSIRHSDLLARTGVGRFVVLALADSKEEAEAFEDRLRTRVAHHWSRLGMVGPRPAIDTHTLAHPPERAADQIVALVRRRALAAAPAGSSWSGAPGDSLRGSPT